MTNLMPTEENKTEIEEQAQGVMPNKQEASLLEQIKKEKSELDSIRARVKAENDRAERLLADAQMSGKGFAGVAAVREETPKEYAEKVLKGKI